MKTIYTDKYGVFPWAMLAIAALEFISAYEAYGNAEWFRVVLRIFLGLLMGGFALNRFHVIRKARAEGRDPTILRIKDK